MLLRPTIYFLTKQKSKSIWSGESHWNTCMLDSCWWTVFSCRNHISRGRRCTAKSCNIQCPLRPKLLSSHLRGGLISSRQTGHSNSDLALLIVSVVERAGELERISRKLLSDVFISDISVFTSSFKASILSLYLYSMISLATSNSDLFSDISSSCSVNRSVTSWSRWSLLALISVLTWFILSIILLFRSVCSWQLISLNDG